MLALALHEAWSVERIVYVYEKSGVAFPCACKSAQSPDCHGRRTGTQEGVMVTPPLSEFTCREVL